MATDDARRLELTKIHLGKRDLRLADEDYREILHRVTGKRSAADLSGAERRAVLAEFHRLGWNAAPPRAREDDWIDVAGLPSAPHLKKALALAFELQRRGAVRSDSTKRWLRSFIKRVTGVDDLRWLTPTACNTVIEALKGWVKRLDEKKGQEVEEVR
jgi:phage gp16-like protein